MFTSFTGAFRTADGSSWELAKTYSAIIAEVVDEALPTKSSTNVTRTGSRMKFQVLNPQQRQHLQKNSTYATEA